MTKILRTVLVFAVSVAALLGTTSLASAAPAPKLTPKQVQALCIAKESIALLKAVERQTWRDPRARAAAIKAIPAKAKAACPLGGTTPPPPAVPPADYPQVGPTSAGQGERAVTQTVAAAPNRLTNDAAHPCTGDEELVRIGAPSTLPNGVTAHGQVNSDGVTANLQVRNTTSATVSVTYTVICKTLTPP